jgi:hypothetical protein
LDGSRKKKGLLFDNKLDNEQEIDSSRFGSKLLFSAIWLGRHQDEQLSPSSWCVCQFRHFRKVGPIEHSARSAI